MVKYWDRLEPEMKKCEMDITALSIALKISFQAVAKVRDGGSFGSKNNLKAAALFGLDPTWLATGIGQKYAQNTAQLTAPSAFLSTTGGPGGAAVSQDTASPPSSPESIGQAVEFIASKLAPLDQGTRETIATLVHEAICKPEKTAANLAAIQALVRFATGKIETEAYLHTAKAS